MRETDIYSQLTKIFNGIFLDDSLVLTPTLTANNVDGWDSMKQIEILMACETKFGIKFSLRELDKMENVGDLAAAIAKKI